MKIALVHYSAPPVIGGVETILAAHAQLFAKAGHEVRVVVRRGGDERAIVLRAEDPLEELRAACAGCDLVIVHNVLTMPFDLPLTQALWRLAEESAQPTRWIAWVHDLAAGNPSYPHPYHQAPWRQLAQACPRFEYIAISEHRARQFESLTGVSAKTIPNAVDPAEVLGLTPPVAELTRHHALLERDIVLLHPTRLLRRKNVELGLEVTAELRGRGRNVAYLVTGAPEPHLVGSAEYGEEVRQRRGKLGLEGDAFLISESFAVTNADLAALYALADALFFPSRQEGFGLPLLEAALHRLPIFCADLAPMNALFEHSLFTFAPEATPAEIATRIERN
jgi:glycosyltransferase involved in cell wall biosynthesis